MEKLSADIWSYKSYMAKYLLVSRNAKEVVDVQRLNGNLNDAKEYFQNRKQFESKSDFERLYEVKQEEKKEQQIYRDFR